MLPPCGCQPNKPRLFDSLSAGETVGYRVCCGSLWILFFATLIASNQGSAVFRRFYWHG